MSIKENMLRYENNLSQYASKSTDAIRYKKIVEDIRPNYFRDIDRIIYSRCYTRYMDKTQVFSFKENDHITKRIIHVHLVSKIARTIGRALGLNEDLIEAISLGHDVGHVPFGHVGESALNEISMKYLNEPFLHNVQSVRNLMFLEKNGKGLNLSIQVLDGILCHNGEKIEQKYTYKQKTPKQFYYEYLKCYDDLNYSKTLEPMTLEGCVVRLSDVIAYLGKDIEDAITLGVISKKDIPDSIKKLTLDGNTTVIDSIIYDVIKNSYNKPYIKISDECLNNMNELLEFNRKNIYAFAYTSKEHIKIKKMFNKLFDYYLNSLKNKNLNSSIFKIYLKNMNKKYIQDTKLERIVIDYIAGMTDDYFVSEFKSIKLD